MSRRGFVAWINRRSVFWWALAGLWAASLAWRYAA